MLCITPLKKDGGGGIMLWSALHPQDLDALLSLKKKSTVTPTFIKIFGMKHPRQK